MEEAHVTELTGLLRHGPGQDHLGGWPATMRVFARRERPRPGAPLSLFEAEDGWRYSLWVTNLPGRLHGWRASLGLHRRRPPGARPRRRRRPHRQRHRPGHIPLPRVRPPRRLTAAALTAAALLAWLRLLALDGPLAKAEPQTLRYRILHASGRLARSGRRRRLKIAATWPWATAITAARDRVTASPRAP